MKVYLVINETVRDYVRTDFSITVFGTQALAEGAMRSLIANAQEREQNPLLGSKNTDFNIHKTKGQHYNAYYADEIGGVILRRRPRLNLHYGK